MTSPFGSFLGPVMAYARTRGLLVGSLMFVTLVVRFATMPRPAERSVEAISGMLGASVGGTVKPDDFVWEGRGGVLHDALVGRRVLFLAALNGSSSNDLFRAEVRLTRAGRPIALRRVVNLTKTPRGHEHDLVAQGQHAAYATNVGSVVQTISVLELAGDLGVWEARTRSERFATYVENWIGSGSSRGIGRIETSFVTPPKQARFELTSDALVMALGESAQAAAVSLSDASVNPGPRDEHGVRAQRLPHPVTPGARFVEQSLHATLGLARAEQFRGAYARLHDTWARLRESSSPPMAELPPATGGETTANEGDFPPPKLVLRADKVLPGEGLWLPASREFPLPGASSNAPPAFFETRVRPDPKRPHSVVRLVAMDGRRLELRPVAGTVFPRSETGLHGDGRIAAADASTAVAVFASGVPDGSDAAGVVLQQQTIVFPRRSAPTLAVDRFGRPALGPWPLDEDVPATIRAVWQTSAPLIVDGKLATFAASDARDARLITRSGLGVTSGGHLVYAYGESIPTELLARALQLAGCQDALALSTGPDPVGFGFVSRDGETNRASTLFGSQSFDPKRFWTGSPHEFVYVVVRPGRPEVPLPEGVSWEADAGPQPDPTWQPALLSATVTKLGAQVKLTLFAPERFNFRIRAGSKELTHRFGGTFPDALAADEQGRVLVAIGLGTAKRKAARGLAMGGSIGVKFDPGAGVLVVESDRARIERSEAFTPTAECDAAELPLTADEGRPLPEARIVGSMRPRAGLCVLDDGSVLVATTTFDTDEATTDALVDSGCARVVALDRGTHQNAYLHRAGSETPPEARYETSTLYVLKASMKGRAISLR